MDEVIFDMILFNKKDLIVMFKKKFRFDLFDVELQIKKSVKGKNYGK